MSQRDKAILPLLLSQLRLPTMKQQWERMAEEAEKKGWSGPRYLSNLCEHEIADRERRRLGRHMTEALLPKGKTLESYDFANIAGINKGKVLGLASGEVWIKEGMNVLIFGPSGVGKTHLAAAIGDKLVGSGFRVLFNRTTDLVQKLQGLSNSFSVKFEIFFSQSRFSWCFLPFRIARIDFAMPPRQVAGEGHGKIDTHNPGAKNVLYVPLFFLILNSQVNFSANPVLMLIHEHC